MSHNLWRHYSAFDLDCGPTDSLMVEAVADIPLITGDETVDKTFPKIKSSFFVPQEGAREFYLSQKRLHHQLYIRHQQQHHQLYPQPNLLIWLAVLVTFFIIPTVVAPGIFDAAPIAAPPTLQAAPTAYDPTALVAPTPAPATVVTAPDARPTVPLTTDWINK